MPCAPFSSTMPPSTSATWTCAPARRLRRAATACRQPTAGSRRAAARCAGRDQQQGADRRAMHRRLPRAGTDPGQRYRHQQHRSRCRSRARYRRRQLPWLRHALGSPAHPRAATGPGYAPAGLPAGGTQRPLAAIQPVLPAGLPHRRTGRQDPRPARPWRTGRGGGAAGGGVRHARAARSLPGRPARADRLPLGELLPRVDALTLHCPLTEDTRGMLGAAELALMKPGAFLVNTARGGLVDEQALADALRGGHLRRRHRRAQRRAAENGNPLLAPTSRA